MSPEQIRQQVIRRERWIKSFCVMLLLALGLVIILVIPGMLIACILAFVITFMFKPVVNFLERSGLSRTNSVLLPFLVTSIVLVALSSVFVPRLADQVSSLQVEIPKYAAIITNLVNKNSSKINSTLSHFSKLNLADEVIAWAERTSSILVTSLPNWLSLTLSTLILAPFFAFFMLKDGRAFVHKLLALVPNNLFELALNLQFQMNQQMGGFIRARFLESALVGAIVWIGLTIMGFPYAAVLAVLAGVTNIIPYIGPIMGAAPAIMIALANEKSALYIGLIGAVYVLAQILDMLLVIPLVVAKIVDLHPVMVVIVIIIGGQVMGVLGMIISIPVASILKLTFTEFYNHVVDFRN